ncbi:hypothetical protein QJS10_CPB14g00174 [Acorus calamus]|uniref:C3HC-type domain-containing protein n=1 Tax=Acorus calamus TaxID=4465 RepID=A0AAV9DAM0_ACOCL|nr:hypothetical protein QJS10_CPB14g00174 [Acorus calamus]
MAEDPEKSLNKALDKLFHAPRTRQLPYPSSAAKKRTRTSTVLGSRPSILGGNHEVVVRDSGRHPSTPLCRPWERQDLMKRLATFKSMTWFAKPKVISPVNCARRGWVNVEMDIIACEACGARLLFSTPVAWSREQVEKAAAVFSLKLDSGHKLLCPWIDNVCDEKLALFPPTAVPALVEGYQERFSSILKISALPIISSSATDYMRSPQLESFLAEPMQSVYSLDDGIRLSNIPRSKELDNASESTTEILYYQALKIISLCGWEHVFFHILLIAMIALTATTSHEMEEIKDGQPTCHKYQYDPASVVLDCNLCGASVGLWAFSTVRQPLESFTLIESPEANSQDKSVSCNVDTLNRLGEAPRPNSMGEEDPGSSRSITDISCDFATSQEVRPLNLNLTIAGGPPPAKQNFRATISLPLISRHFRAELYSIPDARHSQPSSLLCIDQAHTKHASQNTKISQHEKHTTENALIVWSEGAGSKRKRMENELGDSEGSHSDDHANINGEAIAVEGTPEHKESTKEISSEGRCHDEQEIDLLNTEKDLKKMEFDSIKQHRPFCPWIASMDGAHMPGWKQLLDALTAKGNDGLLPARKVPAAILSSDEVDDPIVSIRNLFSSPVTKRLNIDT